LQRGFKEKGFGEEAKNSKRRARWCSLLLHYCLIQVDTERGVHLLTNKLEQLSIKEMAGKNIYVACNCLFSPPNEEDIIDEILSKIENTGLDFNIEGGVAAFLGVLITPHIYGTKVKLTQTGLIACIIMALGLDAASLNTTPAEHEECSWQKPVGMGCQEAFTYASMLGMMGYLIHKWLKILVAVKQYRKYSPMTKHVYEVRLKQIWIHSVGTQGIGSDSLS
jgi:hypothetical protein